MGEEEWREEENYREKIGGRRKGRERGKDEQGRREGRGGER